MCSLALGHAVQVCVHDDTTLTGPCHQPMAEPSSTTLVGNADCRSTEENIGRVVRPCFDACWGEMKDAVISAAERG